MGKSHLCIIVTLENIMIISETKDQDEHDVAIINISGSYLHTERNRNVIMLLRGSLAEFMAVLDPKLYQKYLTRDQNGKTLLYFKVLKALYDLLKSLLLFYKNIVKIWKIMLSIPIHTIYA